MILTLSLLPLLYLIFLTWLRNGLKKSTATIREDQQAKVSVIIAARNEEKNIGNLLENLGMQNYPQQKYEVIVANDDSDDDTEKIVNSYIKKYPVIKQLVIKDTPSNWAPKKWALAKAMEKATGDIFLFTDADCTMGLNWIYSMTTPFNNKAIGLVAGPSPLEKNDGVWNQMLRLDSIGQDALTAGSIGQGTPLTCSGRNLAIRRTAFNDSGGYDKIESFISGDDDLMMHKIITTGWKASFSLHTDALVSSPPPVNFREFVAQRLRFASKGKSYYSLPFISKQLQIVLPFLFITNLSVLISQLVFLVSLNSSSVIPWIIKMVGDWILINRYALILSSPVNISLLAVTGIWHSLYVVVFGLLGSFIHISWKGRRSAPEIN